MRSDMTKLTGTFREYTKAPHKRLRYLLCCGVPRGVWGVQTPHPEIPKALQNRAKLNPTVKTIKNC